MLLWTDHLKFIVACALILQLSFNNPS